MRTLPSTARLTQTWAARATILGIANTQTAHACRGARRVKRPPWYGRRAPKAHSLAFLVYIRRRRRSAHLRDRLRQQIAERL